MIRRTYYLLDCAHPAFGRDLTALQAAFAHAYPGHVMPTKTNGSVMVVNAPGRVDKVSGSRFRMFAGLLGKPRYPGSVLDVSTQPFAVNA